MGVMIEVIIEVFMVPLLLPVLKGIAMMLFAIGLHPLFMVGLVREGAWRRLSMTSII
jgi:hypothetical protein